VIKFYTFSFKGGNSLHLGTFFILEDDHTRGIKRGLLLYGQLLVRKKERKYEMVQHGHCCFPVPSGNQKSQIDTNMTLSTVHS